MLCWPSPFYYRKLQRPSSLSVVSYYYVQHQFILCEKADFSSASLLSQKFFSFDCSAAKLLEVSSKQQQKKKADHQNVASAPNSITHVHTHTISCWPPVIISAKKMDDGRSYDSRRAINFWVTGRPGSNEAEKLNDDKAKKPLKKAHSPTRPIWFNYIFQPQPPSRYFIVQYIVEL